MRSDLFERRRELMEEWNNYLAQNEPKEIYAHVVILKSLVYGGPSCSSATADVSYSYGAGAFLVGAKGSDRTGEVDRHWKRQG